MNELIQNLVMTSAPSAEPVSLDVAKVHCRVSLSYTGDDAYILALIVAAREYCEKETRRSFVARTYELRMNGLPCRFASQAGYLRSFERFPVYTYGEIRLPKPPLIAVESITYIDMDGNQQTLDPSQYQVDAGGVLPGTICPAYGQMFPQNRYQLDSARITYQAGYGTPAEVPSGICQAMLLLIGHWYRNRESVSDAGLAEVPMGVKALLSSFQWSGVS